jgi:hypothetical protein
MNWKNQSESLRGTGRTTRLVKAAVAAAQANDGKDVYIVVNQITDIPRLNTQFLKIFLNDNPVPGREFVAVDKIERAKITLSNGANVHFIRPENPGFNWSELRVLGSRPDAVVLVDHFAIESNFHRLLEMLHRFDK